MPAEIPDYHISDNGQLDTQHGKKIQVVEEYPVVEGIASVRILLNSDDLEHIYFVKEPENGFRELKIIDNMVSEIERMIPLLLEGGELDTFQDLDYVISKYISDRHQDFDNDLKKKLMYAVQKKHVGFGKLHVAVLDAEVEDVSCNGPGMPVFVYHKKYGSLKTNIYFKNEAELSSNLVKFAQLCGKEVSVSSPILDGITNAGHRIQGMYGHEISPKGSAFTIRLFREKPFTPIDLMKSGSASAEMIAYFWYMVEYLNSALIVGPPAVGKTSTLNSILMLVPPNTKIFSIEETREINILHPNWVAASTRETSNTSASFRGTDTVIDLFELVKMAMRQRPTYLAVGEVRGKEAYTLFQAMSTGHTTYSTMHAESMSTLLNRLESEPLNVPRILVSYLKTVIIAHFIRKGQGTIRRITEVNEIVGVDSKTGEVIYNRAFSYDSRTDTHVFSGYSLLLKKIAALRNIDEEALMKEFQDRISLIDGLANKENLEYREIAETVSRYYNGRRDESRIIRKSKDGE